jgi:hypothetical protein
LGTVRALGRSASATGMEESEKAESDIQAGKSK